MTVIYEVNTKKMMSRFIRFPHQLYSEEKNYVPALNLQQEDMLNIKSNPFFRNSKAAFFLAIDDQNKISGRIAAIYNKAHLDLYNDFTGFFGFFDCIDDPFVAGLLLDKAAEWLLSNGLTKMIGPENFTTNDSAGILIKGFDDPPCFLMPYNFPYYEKLIQQNGFQKALTLYSYKTEPVTLPQNIFQKSETFETRLLNLGIRFRFLDFKIFTEEMMAMQKVYNEVNKNNWGFIPLDNNEFIHMANDLRKLVDKESVLFAEKEGKLIGFVVSVPDFNQAFKKITKGKLFPLGWWHLLRSRKYISRIRIMIMGVLPEWRGLGIDWCLYAKVADYVKKNNLEYGEACYVMENNVAMNKMMRALGASIVKEYRLFEKNI
jgi:ribosomal protein S18 acetylase RimI-like enzyme